MKSIRSSLYSIIWSAAIMAAASAADIGNPAPDFSATDAKGTTVSLAGMKGKIVVLEWINFGCPFVKKHYDSGNMQKLQKSYAGKGVVWVTVNSGTKASGTYLEPAEFIRKAEEKKSGASHLVIDESGAVGKAFGAKVTPHVFIVDAKGVLVYDGAVDSIKSTDPEDVEKAVNHVAKALDALLEGKPVEKAKTEPYGCGVKY
ncbi:MAG: redoxin family protein [Verrucomicrobia bacterium]|nr:redoxin family protein [Verrucomicrobiota bacterium]